MKMEDVPVWFGPATIRSMKNNFLAHIKGCAKCRASQEPDEVCPEGAEFVDALGMDRQEKPPERPASIVKRSTKAKADRAKWIKKKTDDLQTSLDKVNDEITDFEIRRADAVTDKEKVVRGYEQNHANAWARIGQRKQTIEDRRLEAEGISQQRTRLGSRLIEIAKLITSDKEEIEAFENTIRHIETDQKVAQSDLDLAGEPFDPKLVALRRDRDKLTRRIESHARNNQG